MRPEKEAYTLHVGPGGRDCPCCAFPMRLQRRYEHRQARRHEKAQLRRALIEIADDNPRR